MNLSINGSAWAMAAALSASLFLSACGEPSGSSSAPSGAAEPVAAAIEPTELVVYSARKEYLIKPLFDRYQRETGIKVSYVTDSAGPLLARLQAEGSTSPADILMTVDAGNLWQAAEKDVLQAVDTPALEANVPAHLRDPEGYWYALTVRARTIVYSTERVDPATLSSYEALADPKWAGRLCLRTSKKVYNQSLVATLIANDGEAEAERVVKGWVNNLALPPFANDTMVMEAIVAGQCDVGIVNTYYYGRLLKQKPDTPLALFWPNQADENSERGVHINISGAGVTRASQQPEAAAALIGWLTELEAQQMLMELNQEYPVNAELSYSPELQSWGEFRADQINVSEAGRLQAEAVKLMDRAGYR